MSAQFHCNNTTKQWASSCRLQDGLAHLMETQGGKQQDCQLNKQASIKQLDSLEQARWHMKHHCKATVTSGNTNLETAADVDYDHDFSHTNNPDRVPQGVHNLTPCCAAKSMIACKANSKVAVCHQGVSNPHAKLHRANKQSFSIECIGRAAGDTASLRQQATDCKAFADLAKCSCTGTLM